MSIQRTRNFDENILSRNQLNKGIRTAHNRAGIRIMPSSWIRNIDYNYETNQLNINMSGKWYGPWQVDLTTYNKFLLGKAVCVTSDDRNRWRRGDSPSLGAAYHRWIKVGGGPSALRRLRAGPSLGLQRSKSKSIINRAVKRYQRLARTD